MTPPASRPARRAPANRTGRFSECSFVPEMFAAELRAALPSQFYGLGRFLHAFMGIQPAVSSGPEDPSRDTWPCPPPPLPSLKRFDAGARRRQRWRRRCVVEELVRFIVLTLNWLALGCAADAQGFRCSPARSAAQRAALARIRQRFGPASML